MMSQSGVSRTNALPIAVVQGYHSHIYFDHKTVAIAETLIQKAAENLPVTVGRLHKKMVGPHPMWSCQLSYHADAFASVFPWLMLNRSGLIVFSHPVTGNDWVDHTDYAMWLGAEQPLKLELFR